VAQALKEKFHIEIQEVVADEQSQIEAALRRLAALADVVVTTGGTGVAARDVTPEATRAVCSRLIEGLSERMRAEGAKKTALAALSRGVCGVCHETLIINVPGSLKGATESLAAIIDLLPHVVDLLHGKTAHAESHRK
jgi:molybdenum cofactor synthesis domain-containing protein